MVEEYFKYAKEMQFLSNCFKVYLNDNMYYNVKCYWFWISDAPAKHALCGWMPITSLFAVLPQIRFYNLYFKKYDKNNNLIEEEIKFITKNNWSLLKNVTKYYTPISYKKHKESIIEDEEDDKTMEVEQEPFGVLLNEELNQEYVDNVNIYMKENYPNLVTRKEQYPLRFEYCKNILQQPQLFDPVPYSFHPILALLHMNKTVALHCCTESFNFFLMKDFSISLDSFKTEFDNIVESSLSGKFTNWLKNNSSIPKNNNPNGIRKRKKKLKSFAIGNLIKRQAFDLFIKSFHMIINLDNMSNQIATHYFTAWSLVVRCRIAECILIYIKKEFTSSKKEVIQAAKLNSILKRLIFNFFPNSVYIYFFFFHLLFIFLDVSLFIFNYRCIIIYVYLFMVLFI